MSLESQMLPSSRPETLENNESLFKQRLYDLQLEYVDGIMKGRTPFIGTEKIEDMNLGKLLLKFTDIRREVASRYTEQTGKEASPEDSEYSTFFDSVFEGIKDAYTSDSETWRSQVQRVILEAVNTLPRREKEKELQNEKKESTTGLVNYHSYALREFKKYHGKDTVFTEDLASHGITGDDDCISVHFEPLVKQKSEEGKEVGGLFSESSSLSKLAVEILEKKPSTRVLLGQSWLLDTPIATRIGFHVSEPLPVDGSLGLWYQFIDKDGNLKKDEIAQFFTTGKPRFYEREGYMFVEDFLKKYLPPEKRGELHLKKAKPELSKDLLIDRVMLSELTKIWDSLSEQGIEKIIRQRTFPTRFFYETEEGKKILAFFFEQKRAGYKYADVREKMPAEYQGAYEAFLEKEKYEDYTVLA